MASCNFEFKLVTYIVHILPAAIIDEYFKWTREQKRFLSYYRKLHSYLSTAQIFSKNRFTFDNNNALTVYLR